jgi:hypothetical protein
MSENNETEPTIVKKEPLKLVMGDTVGVRPKYPEGLSIWPDSYKIKLPADKIHPLSELGKENNNG